LCSFADVFVSIYLFIYVSNRLEDLVAQDDIVMILTNLIDSNNLPHLLLYGPPGMYFVFFFKFDFEFTVCFIIDLLVE
jgi:hypothetical protein